MLSANLRFRKCTRQRRSHEDGVLVRQDIALPRQEFPIRIAICGYWMAAPGSQDSRREGRRTSWRTRELQRVCLNELTNISSSFERPLCTNVRRRRLERVLIAGISIGSQKAYRYVDGKRLQRFHRSSRPLRIVHIWLTRSEGGRGPSSTILFTCSSGVPRRGGVRIVIVLLLFDGFCSEEVEKPTASCSPSCNRLCSSNKANSGTCSP